MTSKFLLNKKEEYKNDEVLSKFLASDESDEYKYSIIRLLEEDYKRPTYDGSKFNKKRINKELAMKLNEIKFVKFKGPELKELAKNLGIKYYNNLSKQKLIEGIELVKKQFCNE